MMNIAITRIVATVAICSMMAACAQPGQQGGINKEMVGTVVGAGAGAAAGSQVGKGTGNVIAIAISTLLGAHLGREVGGSLDRADVAHYNQVSQRALETGQPGQVLPWQNPQTGNSGAITPQVPYQAASGQYCREYTQTITVGGRTSQGYGTACRQSDGTWKIISQQ